LKPALDFDKTNMNKGKVFKSPCNGECRYSENKICISCKRSMNEIVNWVNFDEDEKLQVLKRIKKI